MTTIFQTSLRFENDDKSYFKLTLIFFGFSVVLGILIVKFFYTSAFGVFLSQVLSFMFTYMFLIKKLFTKLKFNILFDELTSLIKYSYPTIITMLGSFMNQHFSKILVSGIFIKKDFITFVVALKIGILYLSVEQIFKTIWQPEITRNVTDKNRDYFITISKNYCAFFLIFLLILNVISYHFVYIYSSETYINAAILCPLIITTFYVEGLKNVFSIGNQIKRKIIYNSYSTIFSGLLSLMLIFFIKDKFDLLGIAVILCVTTVIQSFLIFATSQKNFKIDFDVRYITYLILIILQLTAIFTYIQIKFLSFSIIINSVISCIVIIFFVLLSDNFKKSFYLFVNNFISIIKLIKKS